MSDVTLKMLLLGEDRSAGKAVKGLGDDADKAGEKLHGMGEKGLSALEAIGVGGGLALGAGLVGALNVEAANDKLAGQLGATPEKAKMYGKAAGDLYSGAFGTSMEQVDESIKLVVQNIKGMRNASQADLEAVAGDVLTVANTFDEDLGGVTRAVSQLMRNGLAPNAQAALDIITTGLQNGTNKSDDLLDTFNEYSTMFRDVGLNGKQALGLMSQGLQAGARDADTVADALKEFAIRAQDGSETSAAGFKAVGLNAEKMTQAVAKGGPSARKALGDVLDGLRKIKDPAERNAAAVALFGTKAEDLGDSLYNLDLDTAASKLGKVKGATKEMSDTVNGNALTALTEFKRGLEQAFVNTLGGKVIPFIQEHKELVIGAAIVLAAFVVGIKTYELAMAAAGVVTKVMAASQAAQAIAAGTATEAQIALNAAMRANLIGLIVTALILLVGGLIVAYKKSETFRDIVNGAFKAVGTAFRVVWNNFLAPVFQLWGKAISIVLSTWAALLRLLGKVPGFGWAKDLADKLDTAAGKARNLDLKLHDVTKPRRVRIDTSSIDYANAKLDRILTKLARVSAGLLTPALSGLGTAGGGKTGSTNAVGTSFFGGGLTRVGERGPEIAEFPRGTRIYTAADSARAMAGGGSDDLGTLVVVVRDEDGRQMAKKLAKLKRDQGGLKLEFES